MKTHFYTFLYIFIIWYISSNIVSVAMLSTREIHVLIQNIQHVYAFIMYSVVMGNQWKCYYWKYCTSPINYPLGCTLPSYIPMNTYTSVCILIVDIMLYCKGSICVDCLWNITLMKLLDEKYTNHRCIKPSRNCFMSKENWINMLIDVDWIHSFHWIEWHRSYFFVFVSFIFCKTLSELDWTRKRSPMDKYIVMRY